MFTLPATAQDTNSLKHRRHKRLEGVETRPPAPPAATAPSAAVAPQFQTHRPINCCRNTYEGHRYEGQRATHAKPMSGGLGLFRCLGLLSLCFLPCAPSPLPAQPPADNPAAAATEDADAEQGDELPREQDRVADRYQQLENLIFKMADYEATSNPRRAALLKQAYKQSKDRLTLAQLNKIAELLQDQKYKGAIDGQKTARQDLGDLLRLLMSEDRSDRLKSEQQRIKEYIKELKRIERIQRGIRGRTETTRDPRRLAGDQEKAADRTGELAEQIERDDARSQPGSSSEQSPKGGEQDGQDGQDGKDGDSGQKQQEDSQDGQPADEKDSSDSDQPDQDQPDQEQGDQEQGDDQDEDQSAESEQNGGQDGKSSDGKQNEPSGQSGDASQNQDSQQSDQQDSPGQSQQDQSTPGQGGEGQSPEQQQNPAQQRVREAEQKMQDARRELEEAQRSESVEKQTEALKKLEEAIAELEEILRQLREEEMERMLALLEARFRKMLEMELEVYEGTVRLSEIEPDKRDRKADIRAGKLAFNQRKIVGEADRALTLLLDEGSSIAFPEVVELMRDDMQQVATRLDQVKVDALTQGLEKDIIANLEELIEALQKAQQDLEEGSQPPMGQPGQAGPPPLVDILAELKMIRSLQVRVNTRTTRYSRLLDDPDDPVGQAIERDLRQAISKLSDQESRIQRITRDIALEKNK